MKRDIDYIVIHCTGASQQQTVESIKRHWRETMGWKNVGYHRIVEANGKKHNLADFNQVTNGAKGYNHNSIHVCYIGGQHNDNRTEAQKAALLDFIFEALKWVENPEKVKILGHRDLPDVRKNCPQFNCSEYSWITA